MSRKHMVTVDELATFMNVGWPGEEWYLSGHAEFVWETTFTNGPGAEVYRPRQPGTLIDLSDYDAQVRWQGVGRDPTGGSGHRLSELFQRWKRTREEAVLVAYVPREKLPGVAAWLESAGCLLINSA